MAGRTKFKKVKLLTDLSVVISFFYLNKKYEDFNAILTLPASVAQWDVGKKKKKKKKKHKQKQYRLFFVSSKIGL